MSSSSTSVAPAAAAGSSMSTSSVPPQFVSCPFTVILFYLYTRVEAPKDTLAWQQRLCASRNLLGRIRIASEGINGTLAGRATDIQAYIDEMNKRDDPEHRGIFAGIEYKFSGSDTNPFPELGMFEVKELTASGNMAKSVRMLLKQSGGAQLATPVKPAEGEAAQASPAASADPAPTEDLHLTPAEFHAALQNFNPETDLLLDTRNAYETAIGMFEGAVDPKLRSFHQLPEWVTLNAESVKSKKRILMYCTGGIRCEKAAVYMKHRTGAEVRQLKGGIHKYLDEFPDGGLFRGKNMVFDGRLAMASTDPTVLGHCVHCATAYDKLSEQVLCRVCKSFVLLCEGCSEVYREKGWRIYCQEHMLLAAGKDYNPEVAPAPEAAPASAASAAASSSSDAAPAPAAAAEANSEAEADAPRPEDSWSPPSSDPGCPDQLHSFLSRFTRAQLQAQLDDIDRILQFYKTSQKKGASRSRNRKANLYLQKKRLEEYIATRPAEAEPAPVAEAASSDEQCDQQPQQADAKKHKSGDPTQQYIPFVPLLNV